MGGERIQQKKSKDKSRTKHVDGISRQKSKTKSHDQIRPQIQTMKTTQTNRR